MSPVTTWLAATTGQPPLAQQINQFLVTHPTQYIYAGILKDNQVVNGAGHTNSQSQYMAQAFTTSAGQTTIGYVIAPITSFTASGSTLGTITLSVYANAAGAPTGAPLVTVTITTEYAHLVSNSVFNTPVLYPLPVTGLTASTTYWLVTTPAGNGSFHYGWEQSNQASGASLSSNGSTWTAQTYGFQYQIYDQTAAGLITATWEDSGARWTTWTYGTTPPIVATRAEYTAGQTASGYNQGFRTYLYSNGLLQGLT